MIASYLNLYKSGELARRVKVAKHILQECTLCPRTCKVERTKGAQGFCKSGDTAVVSSAGPHYGEEPPISGHHGSGTIFFTGCNLRCLFCQNYQISQEYEGAPVSITELAQMMISLQKRRCHNINLVTPTHFIIQILEALLVACEQGLKIPLVYNTNGYDSLETLRLLDGIIDIYLPDIKYSAEQSAKECSGASDYVRHNRPALKEMYRQVGDLVMDETGVAQRGLVIRHLILPERLAGSRASLEFIAREISKEAYVSLMAQYHPCYKADKHPVLNRRLYKSEYEEVVRDAESLGLQNCYIQSLISSDDFLPNFRQGNPFER
jgi:putative pyruvate formate lyase activating enzyme